MADFEKAEHNAVHAVFPTTKIRGCFFHFCQCLWRILQKHGLANAYQQDYEFAQQIKQIFALAFAPPDDMLKIYDSLLETDFFVSADDNLQKFVDYTEDI